jgi:hypothetical protein
MVQHGAEKVAKRRQACDFCHANKRKCKDAGKGCLPCVKRGLPCSYGRLGVKEAASTSPGTVQQGTETHITDINDTVSEQQRTSAEIGLRLLMDAARLNPAPATLEATLKSAPPDVHDWFQSSYNTFFERFHHHWTVVHSGTADVERDAFHDAACIVLIGAWQQDRKNLKELIFDIHRLIVDHHIDDLVSTSLIYVSR